MKTHEVYAFGDSHWRLFFPFTNHGAPGPRHQEGNIVTIDTTANELSGSTMWGLQNPNSRHGARTRILKTIDDLGGVDNVGLAFGEVDARFHWGKYCGEDGQLIPSKLQELLGVYRTFIHDELLAAGRVRNKVFVYYGFRYNPAQVTQMYRMHVAVEASLPAFLSHPQVVCITPGMDMEDVFGNAQERYMCPDGVHPLPETIFPEFVLPVLKEHLK